MSQKVHLEYFYAYNSMQKYYYNIEIVLLRRVLKEDSTKPLLFLKEVVWGK